MALDAVLMWYLLSNDLVSRTAEEETDSNIRSSCILKLKAVISSPHVLVSSYDLKKTDGGKLADMQPMAAIMEILPCFLSSEIRGVRLGHSSLSEGF